MGKEENVGGLTQSNRLELDRLLNVFVSSVCNINRSVFPSQSFFNNVMGACLPDCEGVSWTGCQHFLSHGINLHQGAGCHKWKLLINLLLPSANSRSARKIASS